MKKFENKRIKKKKEDEEAEMKVKNGCTRYNQSCHLGNKKLWSEFKSFGGIKFIISNNLKVGI